MPYKDPAVAKRKNHERYLQKREQILAQAQKYYEEHREAQSANRKRWQQEHPEQMRGYGAKWRSDHPEENRKRILDYKDRLKVQVFDHYGRACKCCGETRKEFLSMDHVNGGGNKHRREAKLTNSTDLYLWIIRHNFPSDFQVLCHNCNAARGFYGYCPHEREQENRDESAFPLELFLQH